VKEQIQAAQDRCFRTTHWSVVRRAADVASPTQEQALESLCATYWFPVYAYVRRKGRGEEDAKDLTQSFFAHLLTKGGLAKAEPSRGRFRTFLLSSVSNFLCNDWDRLSAQKRGGRMEFISIEAADCESRYLLAAGDGFPPEELFDREWAREIMTRAVAQLREECESGGRAARFETLKGHVFGNANPSSYRTAAEQLGATEQGVKLAVLRMRRRLGELMRQEVAETVEDEGEIQAEIQHLMAILSRG